MRNSLSEDTGGPGRREAVGRPESRAGRRRPTVAAGVHAARWKRSCDC